MWRMTDSALVPPHVMAREVGDEVVILDLASGTYFGLDPVGARTWQLIGQKKTVREMCEALVSEYEVGAAELERDVMALLDSLLSGGLIEVAPAPGK